MTTTTTKEVTIKEARRRNRRRQRTGHADRARWRSAPATDAQIVALRVIATETGRTFRVGVSRGEAWRRIREATTLIEKSARMACAPPWYD
jgi:hypothetical protein